jgi:hypothetical protein
MRPEVKGGEMRGRSSGVGGERWLAKRRMHRLTRVLAVALGAVLGVGATAGEAAASGRADRVIFALSPFEGVIADCESFEVINRGEGGEVAALFFFGGDGAIERVSTQTTLTDEYINSVTGKTLTGRGRFHFEIEYADPYETWVGIQYQVVVPGAGVVLLDAGRLVTDAVGEVLAITGRHDVYEADFGRLCEALR